MLQIEKFMIFFLKLYTSIEASDLYLIKEFIQHWKFQKLLDRYDDLYSMDMNVSY